MKLNNFKQQIKSTNTHSAGVWQQDTTVTNTGPSYGKIQEGSGIFKLSYEGENPMRNYVYASIISVMRYALIATASAAVPVFVGWGLKRLNVIGNKDDVPKAPGPTPATPITTKEPLASRPSRSAFKADVASAKRAGEPKNLLCDEIHESSRIVVFSGPGVGKSILANQMGFGIATGKPCGIFPNEVETKPQQVLLIDTEQEDTDLYIRYANALSELPDNMDRVSDCNFNTVEEVTEYIGTAVESWNENGTVILDNITSAFSLQSPEKIRIFYNKLRAIQDNMKNKGVIITYIILCHQTKSAKKMTLQALQGSGNIGNFATAVYGIEKISQELVKFKVLKNRRSKNDEGAYIEKFCKEPYFHFEFQEAVDDSSGIDIKPAPTDSGVTATAQASHTNVRKLSDEQVEEISRLYKSGEMTINQLHVKFGVNRRTIEKYLGLKH